MYPSGIESSDFVDYANENELLSRHMIKTYLKKISDSSLDIENCELYKIRKFIKINDSLRKSRIEWLLGYP